MKLILARPEHAPHISTFYRGLHGEEFPHPEMFDEQTVARLIRDEELSVIVAASSDRIHGCGLGFPQAWNQSLEIGALSVDEIPQRNQIGQALFEALRRLGTKSFGVVYFRARTEMAFRRAREIGATCWGFRPAPGSPDFSDADLLMGFIDPALDAPRVMPPQNLVTRLPFAARIVKGLPAHTDDIPYPKNFPVGAPRGTGMPVISGRIWPTYHSRGNFITIESSAGRYPVETIREFAEKVKKKGVNDLRLALPVNQEQAFVDLLDFGFRPVAYLPGWHLRGPHRFDCVEMVSGMPRVPRIQNSFIERAVAKIAGELEA